MKLLKITQKNWKSAHQFIQIRRVNRKVFIKRSFFECFCKKSKEFHWMAQPALRHSVTVTLNSYTVRWYECVCTVRQYSTFRNTERIKWSEMEQLPWVDWLIDIWFSDYPCSFHATLTSHFYSFTVEMFNLNIFQSGILENIWSSGQRSLSINFLSILFFLNKISVFFDHPSKNNMYSTSCSFWSVALCLCLFQINWISVTCSTF